MSNYGQAHFNDPAIMSMRMTDSPTNDALYSNGILSGRPPMGTTARHNMPMGAPPGLLAMPPPGLQRHPMDSRQVNGHSLTAAPVHIHNGEFRLSRPSSSCTYQPSPLKAQSDGLADSIVPGFRAVTLGPQASEPTSYPPPLQHQYQFHHQPQHSFNLSPPLSSASASMAVTTPSDPILERTLTEGATASPTFTSSDFPELGFAAISEISRRDSSATRSKKTDTKPVKKNSINTHTAKALDAIVVSERSTQDEPMVETPTTNGKRYPSTSPTTTPAMSEAALDRESIQEGGASLPPVALPAVPPVSRKARRLQAKALQAKAKHSQKNTPSATPLMSQTPISPMSPPAPASLPLSPVVEPRKLEQPPKLSVIDHMDKVQGLNVTVSRSAVERVRPVASSTTSDIDKGESSPPPSRTPLEATAAQDAPVPGLSRKARKILAAKAAKEAAEIKAAVAEPEDSPLSMEGTDTPLYPSIRSVTELYEDLRKAFPPEVFLAPSNLRMSSSIFHGAAVSHEPLVDAYTTLSLGSNAHSDGSPGSGLAMSSLQSLLVSLTETISEVLTMLPPGKHPNLNLSILDIMDRDAQAKNAPSMEELTAADGDLEGLTSAVERHSEWMKDQLEKLEALHRQVNLAAIDAVAAAETAGWKSIGGVRALTRISADPLDDLENPSGLGMEELGNLLAEAIEQEKAADDAFKDNLSLLDL